MKIIHKEINNENVSELIAFLKDVYMKNIGQDKSERTYFKPIYLNNYIDKNAKLIYIEDFKDVKAFCLYTPANKDKLIEDFETEVEFYEDDEVETIYKYIEEIKPGVIYLDYIESFNIGYGSRLVDYLKSNYSDIILYAKYEAYNFWEKMNFLKVFGSTCVYPIKSVL